MTAEDALEILAFIQAAGIHAWVDGGWGIDALIGSQTRDHADLDIAVSSSDETALREICALHGFQEVGAEPHNPVLIDGRGRRLDVHFVDFTVTRPGPRGWDVYGDIAYDVGAFEGVGAIGGKPVPCTTAVSQLRSHTGYAFDQDDVHDVLALCNALALDVPLEYRAIG